MLRILACSLFLVCLFPFVSSAQTTYAQTPPAYKDGASVPTITPLTNTTTAVSLVPLIRKGVTFYSLSSSNTVLLITKIQGDCSLITTPVGEPLYPGASVEATINDGWAGQFCGILETAGTVNLKINVW